MGTEDESYRRWVELATRVLADPPGTDPVPLICEALARDFSSRASGLVQQRGGAVTLRPLGPSCAQPLDLAVYARLVLHAPAMRSSLARPGDARVRHSRGDADTGSPQWQELLARLRLDEIEHCLVFPLPGEAAGTSVARSWLVLARGDPLTPSDLERAQRVHRLVLGLRRQATRAGPAVRIPAPRRAPAPSVPAPPGGVGPAVLTARELAVLTLMAEGLIVHAIGRRLNVSPRTVAKHQERIYRKLDTTDRLSAVLRAQASGLVRA